MTEFMGELIGTMILIIFGSGVIAGSNLKATKAEGNWVLITIAWGLAVAMGVYAVGQVTGAHINPAVTLGLATVGDFPWGKVPMYILAQMIGAFVGAVIVFFHYMPHWKDTKDQLAIKSIFCTDPAIRSPVSNMVSEIIGTFVLVMGILFIGANDFTEGLNPLIVGLLIVAIGMSLGSTTGYAINPARDLGPRIAHALLPIPGKGGSDWGYSWIPVLGPAMGGIYGGLFYQAIFEGNANIAFWIGSAILIAILLSSMSVELNKMNHTEKGVE